ncbi:MAG: hypothetical protein ACLFS3_01675 [Candidatus Aenigmatarchaeota archaeon]
MDTEVKNVTRRVVLSLKLAREVYEFMDDYTPGLWAENLSKGREAIDRFRERGYKMEEEIDEYKNFEEIYNDLDDMIEKFSSEQDKDR